MDLSPKLVILLLAALVVATLRIHRFFIRRQFARRHGCQPVAPSFTRDPFLGLDRIPGTLRTLKQHKILETGCSLFRTYGNTFTLKELQRSAILTIEPGNIKTVLSLRFHDYGIHYRFAPFKPLLGEGIFNTDGDHWAASRSLIRPSFTRDQIADLSQLEEFVGELFVLLPRDGTTVVDLQELFFRYTIDSATAFLLGQSVATLKKSQEDLGFAEAFHYAQNAVLTRGTLGPLNMIYRDRKANECNRICRDLAQQFVEEAVQAVEPSENTTSVDDAQPDTDRKRQKDIFSHELASRTSDKQRILDELMNALLAGRDTTASLLSNLFFVLAKNPVIWHKLRAEVAVLSGHPPTYDELRGLKYVQCCVNECSGEDGLSPVFVPKGTIVSYTIYAMHCRTDIYGADANEFRPKRWEDGKLQPRWAYLPSMVDYAYVLGKLRTDRSYLRNTSKPVWHVPFNKISGFVGRSNELDEVKTRFFDHDDCLIMSLLGLGGVGKSRLALELAHQVKSERPQYSVFWVQAEKSVTFEDGILQIGKKLGIDGIDDANADVKALVKQRLENQHEEKWFLILDNADDEMLWGRRSDPSQQELLSLVDYLPRTPNGSILVTTRSRHVATFLAENEVIHLDALSPAEAAEMFINRTGSRGPPPDQKALETLLDKLTNLPLAIVQAASFIKSTQCSVHTYLELLDQPEEAVIKLLSKDFGDQTRYPHAINPIASTWLISFRHIRERHPLAADFLSSMACLHEKAIPLSLLPKADLKIDTVEAIGVLTGYSFAEKRTSCESILDAEELYDVHRLVHLAARNWLKMKDQLLDEIKACTR
ncbi:hypothetical protein DV737_g5163, partial [Chaetothyriales sp. CBS 132003]